MYVKGLNLEIRNLSTMKWTTMWNLWTAIYDHVQANTISPSYRQSKESWTLLWIHFDNIK